MSNCSRVQDRQRWLVAAWYPAEGYGGATAFHSEAEALAEQRRLIEKLGFDRVDVWKEDITVVNRFDSPDAPAVADWRRKMAH